MFPAGYISVIFVVTLGFTHLAETVCLIGFGVLVFGPEVSSAGLLAVEGIDAHEFGEVDEVGDAAGFLEFGVESADAAPGNADLVPELFADLRDLFAEPLQALLAALHSAVVPAEKSELAVEGVDGAGRPGSRGAFRVGR